MVTRRMRFSTWMDTFLLACDQRSVFTTAELKAAWECGKDAKQLAKDNDRLYAEYAEIYDSEEIAA